MMSSPSAEDANGIITVSGLASEVKISGMDANDRLVINGLGGDDVITASGLPAEHPAHRRTAATATTC